MLFRVESRGNTVEVFGTHKPGEEAVNNAPTRGRIFTWTAAGLQLGKNGIVILSL